MNHFRPHSHRDFAPERKPLLLLLSALEIAQDALCTQHPRLDCRPFEAHPALPVSEVLAELLVDRCVDLAELIARYNAAIDHALSADPF
jgi:hypothetical protein